MRVLLLACSTLLLSAAPAESDERRDATTLPRENVVEIVDTGILAPQNPIGALQASTPSGRNRRLQKRPAPLPALYASSVGLQSYDAYTTLYVLDRGGREANPFVRELTSRPPAWLAVKAGTTALTIYAAERLWKRRHRTAAVATMVISNGILAVVAARNTRVLMAMR